MGPRATLLLLILGRLPLRRVLLLGLFAAVAIEAAAVFFRFALRMESTRDTRFLAPFTGGVRIHHGYFGVLMLLAAPLIQHRGVRNLVIIAGVGLVLSDLLHHFLVLWPLTGSPQFDLFYP